MGDRRSGAAVKPAGGLDEQPLIPQARRDRPDKKKQRRTMKGAEEKKKAAPLWHGL